MNAVDLCLVAILIVVMPIRAAWRSMRSAKAGTRGSRYWRNFLQTSILSALGLAAWSHNARSWSGAGFDWPLTTAGRIGMGIAAAFLLATTAWQTITAKKPLTAAQSEKYRQAADTLPQSPGELLAWLPCAVALGCGWEWLYRGYLLGVLAPVIGTAAAVLIAAFAYGIAHGIKNLKQLVASCATALLFTIAYVSTHSLWWLMLIHTGMAVLAGVASVTAATKQAAEDAGSEQIWEASRL